MSGRINKGIIAIILLSFMSVFSYAQSSGEYINYTPYSIYGIGDICQEGTGYNAAMGGVGIATRDNRYINTINPASITARDTLSFMIDFSLAGRTTFLRQNDIKSGRNIFNIQNCAVSFPIYRSSAMMIGIAPYSSTGYHYRSFITDPKVLGYTGTGTYTARGQGSIYQVYAAAAVTFWKKLSIGAQYIYYFGNIDKEEVLSFTAASYLSIGDKHFLKLNGHDLKIGIQFDQMLGKTSKITIGATYKLGAGLRGTAENFGYVSGSVAADTTGYSLDTLHLSNKLRMASEFGVGISYNYQDKIKAELNYTFADWSKSGFDSARGFAVDNTGSSTGSTFRATVSQAVRFGMEYTPNRYDIRYYMKRCTYRAGAYYKKDYFQLDGNAVNAFGITLGMTLPVFRWSNGLSLGLDFGTKGSLANNMVKENYLNFSIGFNLYDIWFRKYKYD